LKKKKLNASIMHNDENEYNMPRIDHLQATTKIEFGSNDGSCMHNWNMSCLSHTLIPMNIYKQFARLGVPSSDITLYFINETKKDKIPKKLELYKLER
jgi:hypothetical protein